MGRLPNLPDGKYRVHSSAGNMFYKVTRVGREGQTVIGPLPFEPERGDVVQVKDKRITRA
ncbi:MAG TPA: hypothetical protein VJK52_02080 [Candidatus Nanoarchaeia archaeon]|nr:hypothetical protein [Candidatus Nanoarchaeia archaeon]